MADRNVQDVLDEMSRDVGQKCKNNVLLKEHGINTLRVASANFVASCCSQRFQTKSDVAPRKCIDPMAYVACQQPDNILLSAARRYDTVATLMKDKIVCKTVGAETVPILVHLDLSSTPGLRGDKHPTTARVAERGQTP
jgi:hypothetical protein